MFFLSLLKLLFTLGAILSLKCFFTLFLILPFVFLIVLFLKFLLILLSTFMLEFRLFSVSKLIIFPPKFNWRRILSVIKSFSFIFSMHFSTRFFLRWSEFFTFFRIVFTIKHAFWWSGCSQKVSHCLPLHPPGPRPPAFLKASIFFLSPPGIMSCFSAKEMHSSKLASFSQ